jgi:CubicO group peptidase (beta-lactamase class C family)
VARSPDSPIHDFLTQRIARGDFPGASYLVADGDRIVEEGALGDAVVAPERIAVTPATLYDLASLTKPLATAILAVRFEVAGRLRLDDRLARHLPGWGGADARAEVTLLDLLTHRSGLPA